MQRVSNTPMVTTTERALLQRDQRVGNRAAAGGGQRDPFLALATRTARNPGVPRLIRSLAHPIAAYLSHLRRERRTHEVTNTVYRLAPSRAIAAPPVSVRAGDAVTSGISQIAPFRRTIVIPPGQHFFVCPLPYSNMGAAWVFWCNATAATSVGPFGASLQFNDPLNGAFPTTVAGPGGYTCGMIGYAGTVLGLPATGFDMKAFGGVEKATDVDMELQFVGGDMSCKFTCPSDGTYTLFRLGTDDMAPLFGRKCIVQSQFRPGNNMIVSTGGYDQPWPSDPLSLGISQPYTMDQLEALAEPETYNGLTSPSMVIDLPPVVSQTGYQLAGPNLFNSSGTCTRYNQQFQVPSGLGALVTSQNFIVGVNTGLTSLTLDISGRFTHSSRVATSSQASLLATTTAAQPAPDHTNIHESRPTIAPVIDGSKQELHFKKMETQSEKLSTVVPAEHEHVSKFLAQHVVSNTSPVAPAVQASVVPSASPGDSILNGLKDVFGPVGESAVNALKSAIGGGNANEAEGGGVLGSIMSGLASIF